MVPELVGLLFGVGLLAYSSERGVDHAVELATALGIPAIVVGVVVVSVGTDVPEIANSILSSAMGHGDINVGDSLGSCLTQISLILGIIAIASGGCAVDKEEIMELGRAELMGLLLAIFICKSGSISRLDAALLISGYVLLVIAMRHYLLKNQAVQHIERRSRVGRHVLMFFICMSGVAIGSYFAITSIISLSKEFQIPEYLVSFFALSVGTSLPELVVDLAAIRRGETGLAIGDIIGSNIVDSTLSIGIGPLISPIQFSGEIAFTTGLWAFVVSAAVILTLGLRRRLDRPAGVFFMGLYLLSYLLLFM